MARACATLRLIVTTNYDRLMERALEASQRNQNYYRLVQHVDGFQPPEMEQIEEQLSIPKRLVLYKLHGTFCDKANGSGDTCNRFLARPIITEEDYVRFLTVLFSEKQGQARGLPRIVRGLLLTSTLLFLGYSLEDWDFRTIHRGMVEYPGEADAFAGQAGSIRSFAIQKDPAEWWVDFWASKQVVIYNIDLYDFANDLKDRYSQAYPN